MDLNSLNEFDINDVDFNNMGSWPVAGKAIMAAVIFSLFAKLWPARRELQSSNCALNVSRSTGS